MSDSVQDARLDERILIFAPVGKDAPLTLDVLQRTDLKGCVCETPQAVRRFPSRAAVIHSSPRALGFTASAS